MNARGVFVAGSLVLALAHSAAPLLLGYIVSAPSARIELPTRPHTPLSTGDGRTAWQLAEEMKAAERFLTSNVIVSTGSPSA